MKYDYEAFYRMINTEVQAEFDLIINEEKRQLPLKTKISNKLAYYSDILAGRSPRTKVYRIKLWFKNARRSWNNFRHDKLEPIYPTNLYDRVKNYGLKSAFKYTWWDISGKLRSKPQQVITGKRPNNWGSK